MGRLTSAHSFFNMEQLVPIWFLFFFFSQLKRNKKGKKKKKQNYHQPQQTIIPAFLLG